jgi:hypothetical protein
MMRTLAAGLGASALFMVVCCSSNKDEGKSGGATGATGAIIPYTGGDGNVIASSGGRGANGTAGTSTGGTPADSCDISKTLPNCQESTQTATMRTVNMLILLDKSGSMGKPGLGSTTSKWDVMKSALNTALGRARLTMNFGLDLFPKADVAASCTGEACCQTANLIDPLPVPVGPGTDTVPLISAALAATTPAGGTPMAAALSRALDYYTTGDGKGLKGDKYVLLVTDGGPNCDTAKVPSCEMDKCTRNLDPDPNCNQAANCCSTSALAVNCLDDVTVNTAIQNLALGGIKTIVVGIPGSDPYVQYLDEFAQSGGMAQTGATTAYYAVADSAGEQGLADTLHAITVDLVKSCVITYTKPPDDPELVNVLVDCNIVPKDPVAGGDGSSWTLDTTAMTITLAGPICDYIINTGATRVDYVFGCPKPPE